MKKNYDFRKAKRGAAVATPPGKTRITIRIDDDVLEWFRKQVHEAGGGNYQTMMNRALREHMEHEDEPLEETRTRLAALGVGVLVIRTGASREEQHDFLQVMQGNGESVARALAAAAAD